MTGRIWRGLPLRRQLIISSLLGAIPLLLLGMVLLAERYASRKALVMDNELQQAKLAAAYVQGWVQSNTSTLRTIAGSNEVRRGNPAEMTSLIGRQLSAQSAWQSVFITDADGEVLAASDPILHFVGDQEYFREAQRRRTPTVSSGLVTWPTGDAVIVLTHPILRDGDFHGIVGITVLPRAVQQVFSLVPAEQGTAIGLWGRDRSLIARTHTPNSAVGHRYTAEDSEIVLSGNSGSRISVNPVSHKPVMIGYAALPGTAWTVVIGIPLTVVLSPVYRMLAYFLVLAVLVIIATLLWAFYSSGMLVRQIRGLADGARAIGAGKLDARVEPLAGGELGELALSINKMAEDLQVTDRMKSDLLRMVSHELRTPLTCIRGSLEVLSAGIVTSDHPKYRELVDMAERQALRLQDMVENLISVARVEAGGLSVAPAPVPLTTLTARTVEQFSERVVQQGLSLLVEAPDDALVLADVAKIGLALNNLLDNALKFTDQGCITLSARAEGDEAVIAIADTGAGFVPEIYPRLFEKFYQAEPLLTRKASGAGLGLYVVKALVEAHGGRVFAHSAGPGCGSLFGFTLPLAEPVAASGERPAELVASAART